MKWDSLRKKNQYIIYREINLVIGKATNNDSIFYCDYDDFEKIKNLSWYETNGGYMAHKDTGKPVITMHRLVTNAPKNLVVDHVNHNTRDNRKSNLRVCTQKDNCKNRRISPKYITEIRNNGNKYYIVQFESKYRGCFKSYEEAQKFCDELINRRNYLD